MNDSTQPNVTPDPIDIALEALQDITEELHRIEQGIDDICGQLEAARKARGVA